MEGHAIRLMQCLEYVYEIDERGIEAFSQPLLCSLF